MLRGVVGVTDVVVVDLSAAISVKLLVGALDKCDSLWVHWALDHPQEFVIVDSSISVLVEGLEKCLNIDVGEVEAGLLAALGKLLDIKSTGSIVVHNLEDTTDAND